MAKKRVDVLLVERNFTETREKAKRIIMAGLVYTDHMRLDKPGMKVDESIPINVKGKPFPYVGRGGLKLEKALNTFSISVEDKTVIDVGSSTGGFTDCALKNGAKQSYAIDVGYNQLSWKLRNDDRVIVMERTNFRYVTPDMLAYNTPDFATIDVSFISLRLILPVLKNLLAPESTIVVLIKPQFEAGKEQVGKKGIVRDASIHVHVLKNILSFSRKIGYSIHGLTFSPITGGDGNIEFLAHLEWKSSAPSVEYTELDLKTFVEQAHTHFQKEK